MGTNKIAARVTSSRKISNFSFHTEVTVDLYDELVRLINDCNLKNYYYVEAKETEEFIDLGEHFAGPGYYRVQPIKHNGKFILSPKSVTNEHNVKIMHLLMKIKQYLDNNPPFICVKTLPAQVTVIDGQAHTTLDSKDVLSAICSINDEFVEMFNEDIMSSCFKTRYLTD